MLRRMYSPASMDVNMRNLVRSGASLLLATDSMHFSPDAMSDPTFEVTVAGEDNLYALGSGHFHWFKAMEEHGMAPMEALKAATRNVAVALKVDKELRLTPARQGCRHGHS